MQVLLIAILLLGRVAVSHAADSIATSNAPPLSAVSDRNDSLPITDAGAGLINITLDDVELSDVVRMFVRISDANIIANPSDLQGRVTLNLQGVQWHPALESILQIHGLELFELPVGSGVYRIAPRRPREHMAQLLFRPPGDASPTNTVTLILTNASVSSFLYDMAWQAHINIAYDPSLDRRPPMTIAYTNADSRDVLVQVAHLLDVGLEWHTAGQCYSFGVPTLLPQPAPRAPRQDTSSRWALVLAPLAIVIAWVLRGRQPKVQLPGPATPGPRPGLATLALSLLYGILLFEAFFASLLSSDLYILRLLACGTILGLVGFLILCASLRGCHRRGVHLAGRRRVVAWILALLPLWLFFADSPPLKGDYTWDDLPIPARNAEESYALANRLWGPQHIHFEPLLPASDRARSNAVAYASQIDKAWADAREYRELVAQLNQFDAIADLTRPTDRSRNPYLQTASYRHIRDLYFTYVAHIHLELARSNLTEAVRALAAWHSCMLKTVPYARRVVPRMLLVAFLKGDIELAHQINRHPACTDELRDELRRQFPPIPYHDISLRNSLLAVYLEQSDWLDQLTGRDLLALPALCHMGPIDESFIMPRPPTVVQSVAADIVARLVIRKNRTRDGLRQNVQRLIHMEGYTPRNVRTQDQWQEERSARPDLTNPGGWFLLRLMTPSYERATDTCLTACVESHLLAQELQEPLGAPLDIRDPYSGKPYRRDAATGRWISAGADGEFYTPDDIRLQPPQE